MELVKQVTETITARSELSPSLSPSPREVYANDLCVDRSFDTFSHERAFAHVPTWMDAVMASRYPPYTGTSLSSHLSSSSFEQVTK